MPHETDLSEGRARPAPLSCSERCALMEHCGEGGCFQLDWLDDLYRFSPPRQETPQQTRPR